MSSYLQSSTGATYSSETLPDMQREVGDRKILRFLSPITAAPFACAVRAIRALNGVDASRVALYTVSGWESMPHAASLVKPGSADEDRAALSRAFYASSNPTEWLRAFSNIALCQISIATGIRGPGMHVLGDGGDLLRFLSVAEETIRADNADVAVLVGFDVETEQGGSDSHSRARAIVVGAEPGEKSLAKLEVVSARAADDTPALTVLERLVEAAETGPAQEAKDISFANGPALRVTVLA